jgi:hypothetical protein
MSVIPRTHQRGLCRSGRWQQQQCQPPFLTSSTNFPGGVFPRYPSSMTMVSSLTSTKRSMSSCVLFFCRTYGHKITNLAHMPLLSQTLVRLGAYQSLDLTIAQALNERSPDFPGVVICTASDSLGTLLQLINKRRVHRLVIVEGEEDERRGGRKGRLLGIITLTDVLRYLVGNPTLQEQAEPPEEKPQPQSQLQEQPQHEQPQQQPQLEPEQSQPQESETAKEA